MSVLVDSDIVIEVTRARDAEILLRWEQLSRSDQEILYSPVTSAEVWCGARPHEFEFLSELFSALLCVPVDQETGRQAGNYLRLYRKSHALSLGDALIASTAVLRGAYLWTGNRKHYPMREVKLFDVA